MLHVLLFISKSSKAYLTCFYKYVAFYAAEYEMCSMQDLQWYCAPPYVVSVNRESFWDVQVY